MSTVTGNTGLGLRWARHGEWRVVAYAEGGYSVQRYMPPIGWCLTTTDDEMPAHVERELCRTLGIPWRR